MRGLKTLHGGCACRWCASCVEFHQNLIRLELQFPSFASLPTKCESKVDGKIGSGLNEIRMMTSPKSIPVLPILSRKPSCFVRVVCGGLSVINLQKPIHMKLEIQPTRLLAPLVNLTLLLVACVSGSHAAQLSDRQTKAIAMWQERCKVAGEKIHKTVENVEGIYLMKLRSGNINYGNQYKLDDPYGRDFGGDGYIQSFLRGSYQRENKDRPKDGPPRFGYRYVEAKESTDGHRYMYTGAVKAIRQQDVSAPNVQIDLKRNPHYDLNIYQFVVDKTIASSPAARYGVTYDDISTHEEREYWIAGSSLKVIDLQTNEVIAERIGYMLDSAQGSKAGGRSPWLFAADNACPNFLRNFKVLKGSHGPAFPSQPYQTLDFVEKVLKPAN